MILINNTSSPKYSALANKTINPGGKSRELDAFYKGFTNLKGATKGFTVRLSDKDIELLKAIIDEWLTPELDEVVALGSDSTYDFKSEFQKLVNRVIDRRKIKQKAISESLAERREKEARIASESNFLDESGNPVNDRIVATAAQQDLTPQLHPEMSSDIKSILENNLAIKNSDFMTRNTIIAGTTKVSHNPADYNSNRQA